MKIYISGTFTAQRRLRPWRDELWRIGHQVTSSWLDELSKPDGMPVEAFNRKLAIKDLAEIKEADCLIIDTDGASTTGGRYVELGYALANHKLIYVVGPQRSVFLSLADRRFDTWDALLQFLKAGGDRDETQHPDFVAGGCG